MSVDLNNSYTFTETAKKWGIGGISATTGIALGLPMNNVKTKIQLGTSYAKTASFFLQNPFRLFSGAVPLSASVFPATAISYVIDQKIKHTFFQNEQLSPLQKLTISTFAGAVSGLAATPSELVFIKMVDTNSNLMTTVNKVFQEQGARGFFHGLPSTALRISIFTGAYLGLGDDHPIAATFLGTILTNPIDTWKTRSQAWNTRKATMQEIADFAMHHSLKGFFPRLASYAIFMATAPKLKRTLEERCLNKLPNHS